jgi:hypothetical protein
MHATGCLPVQIRAHGSTSMPVHCLLSHPLLAGEGAASPFRCFVSPGIGENGGLNWCARNGRTWYPNGRLIICGG